MRLALAVVALLVVPAAAPAADHCADITQAVATLKDGDPFELTAELHAAARFGCEREARVLIDRGASIDARDREGMTALATAARAGKVTLVGLLIEKGADINARSINRSTPLFYAAEADRAEATRVLIDHGADPNISGRSSDRPLAAAAYNDAADSVELLLKHGADPNAVDDDGKGAMVYAAGRARHARTDCGDRELSGGTVIPRAVTAPGSSPPARGQGRGRCRRRSCRGRP